MKLIVLINNYSLSIDQFLFQNSHRVDGSHIERKVIPLLGCIDKNSEGWSVAHRLDDGLNREYSWEYGSGERRAYQLENFSSCWIRLVP